MHSGRTQSGESIAGKTLFIENWHGDIRLSGRHVAEPSRVPEFAPRLNINPWKVTFPQMIKYGMDFQLF